MDTAIVPGSGAGAGAVDRSAIRNVWTQKYVLKGGLTVETAE